ncbi:MAG: hypothetical protein M3Z20_10105 [Chloroflexota bacterium]|nr:hypothetical protein [Chloroflexota bacterium]
MKTATQPMQTSTTRRGFMQAAAALLLAGSVAATLPPGAGASDNEEGLEVSALICESGPGGGEWIEWTGDNGWVMSTSCIFDDGSGYNCDANGDWCEPFKSGAPGSDKDVPDIGGQVGGDLGPTGGTQPGVGTPPGATSDGAQARPSAADDNHKQGKGKAKGKHSKRGKHGKGRKN